MTWEKIQGLLTSARFKGAISLIAALIMYYTPDEIDRIIISLLGLLGISQLVIVPSDGKKKKIMLE
jgi:hypothetical protein